MIRTPLCDLLGIEYPVFQGGMAWIADASLAAAVSEAGGLGIIAAIYRGQWPDQVIRVLSVIFLGTPSFWLASLLVLGFVGSSLPVSGALPSITGDFSEIGRASCRERV